MSGPVPQDDDILVLRFKAHPDGSGLTLLEIWSRQGMSKQELRGMLVQMLHQMDTDDFRRIG